MPKYTLAVNISKNSSVCLLEDGIVVYYLEEERYSKIKNDSLPLKSLIPLLGSLTKPLDEILICGVDHNLPFIPQTNKNLYEILFSKYIHKSTSIGYLTHLNHLTHAFSSFYNSGFKSAVAIIINEGGSYIKSSPPTEGFEVESIFKLEYPNISNPIWQSLSTEKHIESHKTLQSLPGGGISQVYEAVTEYLEFDPSDIQKTVALSSYGKFNKEIPPLFIKGRGNQNLFHLECHNINKLIKEFYPIFESQKPISKSKIHSSFKYTTQFQKDLAFATQTQTQEHLGNLIDKALSLTNQNNIVLGGSCFQNPKTNSYIKKRFPNLNLYFNPLPNYAGISMGVAKHSWYLVNDDFKLTPFTNPYLGPKYNLDEVKYKINQNPDLFKVLKTDPAKVSKLLKSNHSIGIWQNLSESTSQSLGNRSILHNPNDPKAKKHLKKLKNRKEWFMPYSATILKERASEWVDMMGMEESPYSLFLMDVWPDKQETIQSVTHVDGTCRIQTLTEEQNPHYYKLIQEFEKITNIPLLLNTSLNSSGKPLLETIDDVLNFMLNSDLKYLYLPELEVLVKKLNK